MNLLRRAFLYDTRKKGKTILLFLMLFLIFTLILIALAVRNGAERSAAQLRASLGGSFKLSIFADQEDSNLWKTQEWEDENRTHTSFVYTGPAIDEEFLQRSWRWRGSKSILLWIHMTYIVKI
ncbi:hypothetical protein [Zongyangia hominis]|uniref:ABC transporter permease n=1 Tax=Zongyangia hominis TaxID=2763677 RepID=A0A926I9T1_9FIRM|nr:hypothetical protein [Zongyangia hominis]MBC8569491.1 hypothetical protein [Zongyangia hominis]